MVSTTPVPRNNILPKAFIANVSSIITTRLVRINYYLSRTLSDDNALALPKAFCVAVRRNSKGYFRHPEADLSPTNSAVAIGRQPERRA